MKMKRGKTGKKVKQKTRRKGSLSSDDDQQLPVSTSLPPSVEGQLRCFLSVCVSKLSWTVEKHPDDVQIRIYWWGEQGQGTVLRPIGQDVKKGVNPSTKWSSARYPVCSGPKQFSAYLNDMGTLLLETIHTSTQIPFGKALTSEITKLTASQPINVVVPIMSVISPFNKLADVQVYIKFESVSAAYNKLSSAIPTVDIGLDKENVDISNPQPTPPPYLNPATPVSHPRHHKHAKDPFESPAPTKGVKFSEDPPEKLEYTLEPSLLSLLANDYTSPKAKGQSLSHSSQDSPTLNADTKADLQHASSQKILTSTAEGKDSYITSKQTGTVDDDQSTDWISSLLERGQRLREGLAMSTLLEDNVSGSFLERYTSPDRHVLPGRIIKEVLQKDKRSNHGITYDLLHKTLNQPDKTIDDDGEDKMIDLLMGEQHDYMDNTSMVSDVSQEMSEIGDPLHDESLLMDLFYKSQLNKSTGSDHDDSISTEEDFDSTIIDESFEQLKFANKKKKKSKDTKHKEKEITVENDEDESTDQPTDISDDSILQTPIAGSSKAETVVSYHASKSLNKDGAVVSSSTAKPLSHVGLVQQLGADTLTTLGRVNTARVIIDKLVLTDSYTQSKGRKSSTFFVEYYFPIASSKDTNKGATMTTEVTRVASKKMENKAVLFNHRSVFPVSFNASVLEQWSNIGMMFRIFKRDSGQRQPVELGVGVFPLKALLLSSTLNHVSMVEIKEQLFSRDNDDTISSTLSSQGYLPSDSSAMSHEKGIVGNLEVTVDLGVDGRPVHIAPIISTQATIPVSSSTTVTMVSRPVVISCSQQGHQKDVPLLSKPPLPHSSRSPSTMKEPSPIQEPPDILTLHTLLWIQEGKGITLEPHSSHGNHIPGVGGRTNLFLVSRMFWCEEVSKSSVCWGTNNPQFGFRQVAPVLLTPTLLQRTCNNFMVIEVWDKVIPHGEQLIGIVKLPLHQLYLSYRDPKITKTLVKSKFPVVCVDEMLPISNPFTAACHGELKVLLAMGTEEQISSLLAIKGGNSGGDVVGTEIPSTLDNRPTHHLDKQRETRTTNKPGPSPKRHNAIDHQFEITVGDVRGLSVFKSTVWGETDCYVQYNFPHQHQNTDLDLDTEVIPGLKSHHTPTTLCVPDPSFQDITRHSFVLPSGIPVQRYLLAAYSGTWTGMSSLPGSGGVPFELWRRYYYPNVRDQLVAKASLPVAKLCAMVTMQRHREPSVQTFSLPLVVLPDDQSGKQDTGLLEINVKYQAKRVEQVENMKTNRDQVSLSIRVIRACGLKDAALFHSQSNPSMSYPADVGVNAYVVINLPFGRKKRHVTRTVARTFAPDFSHHLDITVPLQVSRKSHDNNEGDLVSLAEKLEMTEAVFELWHQYSRGFGNIGSHGDGDGKHDVLLGVVTMPMSELLICRTGIKGWHAIKLPDLDEDMNTNTTMGGLQLSIKFEDPEDREAVVHTGRSLGWSPPPGIEYEDDNNPLFDSEDEDGESQAPKGLELSVKISRAWVPDSFIQELHMKQSNLKGIKGYVRYKLYDKSPLCSRVVTMRPTDKETSILDIKHAKSMIVPATSSLVWYLREENLEAQVWLRGKSRKEKDGGAVLPGQRDKLVGSAFINLSSLVVPGLKHSQISGVFPLFKAGADAMDGANIHVQISLAKPNTHSHHDQMNEEDALNDTMSSDEYPSTKGIADNDSTSYKSSSDRRQSDIVPQTPPKCTPCTVPDDSFAAHIIIQEAHHLPTIPDSNGDRVSPSVYVSYQTSPSSPTVCTPVIKTSRKPVWEYQKLEHLPVSTLKTLNLVFKVWHRLDDSNDETITTVPSKKKRDDRPGSPSGDYSLGFASVDLAPLAAGLRQLIGWYNIMDFNGQCKGQIKVGIVPLAPVSPSRCLTRSRLHVSSPVSHEPLVTRFSSGSDPSTVRTQTVSSEPFQYNRSVTTDLDRLHQAEDRREQPVLPTSTSSSFLLRQLRQNMQDLDKLQKGLQAKLKTPSPEYNRKDKTDKTKEITVVQKDWTSRTSSHYSTHNMPKHDFDITAGQPNDYSVTVPVKSSKPQLISKEQGSPSETFKQNPSGQLNRFAQTSTKDMHFPDPLGVNIEEEDVVSHCDKDEYGSDYRVEIGTVNFADTLAQIDKKDAYVTEGDDANTKHETFIPQSHGYYDSSLENGAMERDNLSDSDCDADTLEQVSMYGNGKSPFPYVQEIDSWLSSGEDEESKTPVTSLAFTLPNEDHDEHDIYLEKQEQKHDKQARKHTDNQGNQSYHTEHDMQAKKQDIHKNQAQKLASQLGNQAQSYDAEKQTQQQFTDSQHYFHEQKNNNVPKYDKTVTPLQVENEPDLGESGILEAINLFTEETRKHCESDEEDHGGKQDLGESNSFSDDDDLNTKELSPRDDKNTYIEESMPNANEEDHNDSVLKATTLPNFFMPTQQLENSMRALRLGAKLGYPHTLTNSLPKSKLLERTSRSKDADENGSEGIFNQYSRKKVLYKAKQDLQPPLSSIEIDRIARIFSSKD